ncbi:MAG TPA: hypothetical protein VIH35_07245 [Kiritimatiellia bacterium]
MLDTRSWMLDIENRASRIAGALLALLAFTAQGAGITDLGTLGGSASRAYAINAAGEVAGEAETGRGAVHAFVWKPGEAMKDLGTLGGRTSRAYDINDSGVVVGESETTSGVREAFVWTATGGMQRLGSGAGSTPSYAYAINNDGVAAGGIDTADGSRACTWSNGELRLLAIEAGAIEVAFDINAAGYVAGQLDRADPEDRVSAAFIHRSAEPSTSLLPRPAGLSSSARAMNDLNQAAGYLETTNGETHAFVFDGVRGLRDIDTMSNMYSSASAINVAGHVVGVFFHDAGDDDRAFICRAGVMSDLNRLIATNTWLLVEAHDINDAGQVVGYGWHGEAERAFLLDTRY